MRAFGSVLTGTATGAGGISSGTACGSDSSPTHTSPSDVRSRCVPRATASAVGDCRRSGGNSEAASELSILMLPDNPLRPRGKRHPFVVHRIDRDTSGLVLFAKDARTQEALKGQFRRREPERVYLAVVYGHPEPNVGTWRDRLVWDRKALIQKETHPRDPEGTDAISDYRVVETFRDASLIEVRLQTGKRNQIRIQARLRGHTLVGERRYVYGPDELRPIPFSRQALHAYRLAFVHDCSHSLAGESAGRHRAYGLVSSRCPQEDVRLTARCRPQG